MAMRSQVYEWSNIVDTASNASTTRRLGGRFGAHIAANTPTSIFIGGVGNNITKPASTSATQFIVVEDIGCTPTEFHGSRDFSGGIGTLTEYRGLCGGLGGVISMNSI